MQSSIIVQSLGFTNNKTDKILEFKNRGIRAAAGTVTTLFPKLFLALARVSKQNMSLMCYTTHLIINGNGLAKILFFPFALHYLTIALHCTLQLLALLALTGLTNIDWPY